VIASRARRQLRRVSAHDRDAVGAAFSQMCENPFQGEVKYLRSLDALRRRVGDWRILLTLRHNEQLIIVARSSGSPRIPTDPFLPSGFSNVDTGPLSRRPKHRVGAFIATAIINTWR
jgi:mRNA-degrading endonuclease RelE of RelBE toxin-antitoxin system